MNKVNKIIEILEENNIELVSYRLAPNPNGFCYECEDYTCSEALKQLNDLLDSLTEKEENILLERLF